MPNLDHLVVGVDGSSGSELALGWAVAQAPRQLTVVHGFSPGLGLLAASVQLDLDPVRAQHEKLLETTWSAPARDLGIAVDTVLVDDNPANALTRVVAHRNGDAIVVGHQGHGRWSAHHVGETAGKVLHHSTVPVIVTSSDTVPDPLAGTVVVGLSRPADADNAELRWSLDVANHTQANLHLVCLVEPLAYVDASYSFDLTRVHQEMSTQMDALAARLRGQHPAIGISTEVRDGSALYGMADVAEERDACLVVVGSHHPRALAGFVAGSVARLLPPLIDCPTAVVPHE